MGFTEANFRNKEQPSAVGDCVLQTIHNWHVEGKKIYEEENSQIKLDLSSSTYLCVSYRQQCDQDVRQYQIHSFPLVFPKVDRWIYSGRALRGYVSKDPGKVIFDWYGLSGGQLKYYPRAVDALFSSQIFELETPKRLDTFDRVHDYWPDDSRMITEGLLGFKHQVQRLI
ncbi:hypothetical protein OA238_c18830 [Octadecabacter arcticus 238]|uniref:Uncharacterized protein n=1 Tax=Octadecabacter arcticus 238 TaxID=391616 RepID=M9RJQ3_9RHOB|nr:hypothetical protein [Octadecabacter arcticus]AGI71988.1 hypothetical protein OA238_c18830 [Octadecabacter arcticus 238]